MGSTIFVRNPTDNPLHRMKIINEDESVEKAHAILKVWGDALQNITSYKASSPPTLKSWWFYRWNRFRQRTDKWGLLQWYLVILGIIACVLFSSLHQNRVMDLDRTNRIFYKKVIMDEKRKRNYQGLDSLIHSDSFFKTYWSLEHWTPLQKEGQWCNWFVSNSQILIKFRRLTIRFGLAACKVSNISEN